MKNILFKDIERCPYLPSDVGYEQWNKRNDERLEKLSKARSELKIIALQYLSHEDRNVRNLAIFVDGFLE